MLKWPLLCRLTCTMGMIISLVAATWHLQRAHASSVLTQQFSADQRNTPLSLRDLASLPQVPEYRVIQLRGHFDYGRTLLIKRQKFHRRAGFYVLTPFKPNGHDRWMLVNRGWLPADAGHETVDKPPHHGTIHLTGITQRPHALWHWPWQMEHLDIAHIGKTLGLPLYDFLLLEDPDKPDGFVRQWPTLITHPIQHYAYASAWLSLTLLLIIALVWQRRTM